MTRLFLILGLWTLATYPCLAENPATVREYEKTFTTYAFSDPNPIPPLDYPGALRPLGGIYPYFRFDGYASQPVQKSWKVVELENDYLRVMILPEIGGKIWTAIEKSTGKPFLYYNHVVKFRDVAMRGPWTSGGIEANYGIIGHTPNCSTPVDYVARTNPDGSVSCTIGALDLLTRTMWRLKINLPKDKAYFTTASFWHNATSLEQPYYTWMNAGIKAGGNLQLIYPGTHYLGHEGEYSDWPINKGNGRDISYYDRNDFGGYKSYHVFGRDTDFFGGYWHDEDFGMAHWASHDDKPGKKIWIWGLSRAGMIWERLLTDADGQYVEVQSGRLFNQSLPQSTLTPFKHRGFAPYATDTWTEYWFPVLDTKGMVAASPYGALNVMLESGVQKIYFCPVQAIHDKLEVFNGSRLVYSKQLDLKPLEPFSDAILEIVPANKLLVTVGGHKLKYLADPDADVLARPLDSPKDFDWNSVYGLYLQGKENIRGRFYGKAAEALQKCLGKDPNFLPALVEMSAISYRNRNFAEAVSYARKALSIDTYDPGANYYFGLSNKALEHWADARDGFDMACQSIEFRNAGLSELSRLSLRERDFDKAVKYAGESLDFNRRNLEARQLLAVAYRLQGEDAKAGAELDRILAIDSLNHFARFEKYLRHAIKQEEFTGLVRNEMPHETFLELAVWYHGLGLAGEAARVLELAPRNAEALYWLAYLKQNAKFLEEANAATPCMVFPFRSETAKVLQWSVHQSPAWQPRYYLALIYADRNDLARARELFAQCGRQPDYAPFYAARAKLIQETALNDLKRAIKLDPRQWRFGVLLANHFLHQKQYGRALEIAENYARQHPEKSELGALWAKTLLHDGKCQECSAVLAGLNVLPCEGADDYRRLWREAKLTLAIEQMKAKSYDQALSSIKAARQWPENLGSGKPYPEDTDERLEDWLTAKCHHARNDTPAEQAAWQSILRFKPENNGIGDLLTAWALRQSGKADRGHALLASWLEKERSAPALLGEAAGEQVARWCLDAFQDQNSTLPENLQNEHYRIIRGWQATAGSAASK